MNQNIHDALTIGIPTTAVLFGILSTLLVNNRRFDRSDEQLKSVRVDMNHGFDRADEQIKSVRVDRNHGFDRADEQIKSLRVDMNHGFVRADEQIKSLRVDMNHGFDVVHTDLKRFYELTGDLKEKHGELKGRVDTIEKRVG
jgi:hypothetical protein